MKKVKKVRDERLELDTLKVERGGCWVIITVLIVSLIIQSNFLRCPLTQVAGELVALLAGSLFLIAGYLKKGIWDNFSKPKLSTYFFYSLGFSVIFSVVFGIGLFLNYPQDRATMLPATLIFFGSIFLLLFGVLALVGALTKKRQKKLEDAYAQDKEN